MKKFALLLSVLLTVMCLTALNNAYAFQALRFSAPSSYKETEALNFGLKQSDNPKVEHVIAAVDLNNDAIDEYIIRPRSNHNCPKRPLCSYQIVAYQNHAPILIGKFDTHKVRIADKKDYGVQQVILYNEPHNDFKTTTARWNPFSFRFELP